MSSWFWQNRSFKAVAVIRRLSNRRSDLYQIIWPKPNHLGWVNPDMVIWMSHLNDNASSNENFLLDGRSVKFNSLSQDFWVSWFEQTQDIGIKSEIKNRYFGTISTRNIFHHFDRNFEIQVKINGSKIIFEFDVFDNFEVFPTTYFRENFHRAHSANQQTYQYCYWTEPFHRYILSFHPIALEESSCCKVPNRRYSFQINAYICADHKPKYHPPSSLDQQDQPVRLRPTSWKNIYSGWIFINLFFCLFNLTLDNNR